jgi:hypothetical protein
MICVKWDFSPFKPVVSTLSVRKRKRKKNLLLHGTDGHGPSGAHVGCVAHCVAQHRRNRLKTAFPARPPRPPVAVGGEAPGLRLHLVPGPYKTGEAIDSPVHTLCSSSSPRHDPRTGAAPAAAERLQCGGQGLLVRRRAAVSGQDRPQVLDVGGVPHLGRRDLPLPDQARAGGVQDVHRVRQGLHARHHRYATRQSLLCFFVIFPCGWK